MPGVAMLVDFERHGPAMLDGIAQSVQGTDAGVAAPRKRKLARATHADHLVVNQVGCHAHQVETATALANDLVTGGKWNQVRKSLERNARAVGHVERDRFLQRFQFHGCGSTTVRDCSRRYCAR